MFFALLVGGFIATTSFILYQKVQSEENGESNFRNIMQNFADSMLNSVLFVIPIVIISIMLSMRYYDQLHQTYTAKLMDNTESRLVMTENLYIPEISHNKNENIAVIVSSENSEKAIEYKIPQQLIDIKYVTDEEYTRIETYKGKPQKTKLEKMLLTDIDTAEYTYYKVYTTNISGS